MKARDVMTRAVLTVSPDMPVPAAAAFLSSHGFTAAPVVDTAGQLVGIVSEADLFHSPVVPDWWLVQGEPDPTIEQLMTPTPTTMRSADDLADVAAAMLNARIRSIPIVDDGELVGIVTRRDVLRAVARREVIFEDATARRSGGTHPGPVS
jgi:CBS domain-containing protein